MKMALKSKRWKKKKKKSGNKNVNNQRNKFCESTLNVFEIIRNKMRNIEKNNVNNFNIISDPFDCHDILSFYSVALDGSSGR